MRANREIVSRSRVWSQTAVLKSIHKLLIGLRSGLGLGQSRTFMFLSELFLCGVSCMFGVVAGK